MYNWQTVACTPHTIDVTVLLWYIVDKSAMQACNLHKKSSSNNAVSAIQLDLWTVRLTQYDITGISHILVDIGLQCEKFSWHDQLYIYITIAQQDWPMPPMHFLQCRIVNIQLAMWLMFLRFTQETDKNSQLDWNGVSCYVARLTKITYRVFEDCSSHSKIRFIKSAIDIRLNWIFHLICG